MARPVPALALAAAVLGAGCSTEPKNTASSKEVRLLNVSYDPTRELYNAVNAAFAKEWETKTGQKVTIGHVNVLEAHLESGRARVGDVFVDLAGHDEERPRAGRVYVRPHEVEIGRSQTAGTFPARVLRVTPLGGGLKIELTAPSLGSSLRADVDWERGTALGLRDGDDVFLSLRRARVFAAA